MYRNLYPKSSFRSCPYTVLVKCPVRFYRIFDEIGQNVDGKMYFYHRSHCSTTTIESNGSLFSSLAPVKGYAQKNCAERFSALNVNHVFIPPYSPQSLRVFYCFLYVLMINVMLVPITQAERLDLLLNAAEAQLSTCYVTNTLSFGISPFCFILLLSSAILELLYFLMSTR